MSRKPRGVAKTAPGTAHEYASPLGLAVADSAPQRPGFRGHVLPVNTKQGRINLRAVSEVLTEMGLDPAAELVKIVQAGTLPPDIHARILNELLQYTQPKLKSVEVRAKVVATAFDINDEQAKRIAEEFLRAVVEA